MASKSTPLRNSQATALTANLDKVRLKDDQGTVIAEGTISGWGSPNAGVIKPSADLTITGVTAAGTGTDAATLDVYDSASSGHEISGLTVANTQTGGADVLLENTNIADGQSITVPQADFAITENANTA